MTEGFLSIDGGNSRLKATLFAADGTPERHIFAPDDAEGLLSVMETGRVASAAMANVGHTDGRLVETLRKALDERFLLITPSTPLPIRIDYDDPRHLGIDRKATAVAAAALYAGRYCLVIDAGSALTCDVVGPEGFLGGRISPGLSMRYRALNDFTARLPLLVRDADGAIAPDFGRGTEECIRSGVERGLLDEVAGAIGAAVRAYPALSETVVTGGDAPLIVKGLEKHPQVAGGSGACGISTTINYEPDLLAEGIRAIYLYNDNEN